MHLIMTKRLVAVDKALTNADTNTNVERYTAYMRLRRWKDVITAWVEHRNRED